MLNDVFFVLQKLYLLFRPIKGKKVWSLTEIAKLKPSQYAKFEKDIDLARAEGRITN